MEVIRSILDEAVGRNLRLSLKNNQDNKKGKLTGNLKKVESNNGLVDCTLLTEKNITVVVRFFDGSMRF